MITVEIKVNDRIVEVVSAVNISDKDPLELGWNDYLVNGVFVISHKRNEGHRELARKMLSVIKSFKR